MFEGKINFHIYQNLQLILGGKLEKLLRNNKQAKTNDIVEKLLKAYRYHFKTGFTLGGYKSWNLIIILMIFFRLCVLWIFSVLGHNMLQCMDIQLHHWIWVFHIWVSVDELALVKEIQLHYFKCHSIKDNFPISLGCLWETGTAISSNMVTCSKIECFQKMTKCMVSVHSTVGQVDVSLWIFFFKHLLIIYSFRQMIICVSWATIICMRTYTL